jgi:large subunit ribosomal protein LX
VIAMENKEYEITGTFQEKDSWKPYTKVVTAPNENQARERIFTQFGSKHRLKRAYITITTVKEVSGE